MKNTHEMVVVRKFPRCDFDCKGGAPHDAHYDGATYMGPWGYMCDEAFLKHGIGLGLGRGQRLVLREGGA